MDVSERNADNDDLFSFVRAAKVKCTDFIEKQNIKVRKCKSKFWVVS